MSETSKRLEVLFELKRFDELLKDMDLKKQPLRWQFKMYVFT